MHCLSDNTLPGWCTARVWIFRNNHAQFIVVSSNYFLNQLIASDELHICSLVITNLRHLMYVCFYRNVMVTTWWCIIRHWVKLLVDRSSYISLVLCAVFFKAWPYWLQDIFRGATILSKSGFGNLFTITSRTNCALSLAGRKIIWFDPKLLLLSDYEEVRLLLT